MAEIADRVPGGVILASYSNQIRDRAVMRYVDRTARAASEPLPSIGTLSYITTLGTLEIFDGVAWRIYTDDEQLAAVQAELDLLNTKVYSAFTQTPKTLSLTQSVISACTVPAGGAGDYIAHFYGFADYEIDSAVAVPPFGAQWRVNGSLKIDLGQIGTGALGHSSANFAHSFPFGAINGDGLNAGDEVQFYAATKTGSVDTPRMQDYYLTIQRVPVGVIVPEVTP